MKQKIENERRKKMKQKTKILITIAIATFFIATFAVIFTKIPKEQMTMKTALASNTNEKLIIEGSETEGTIITKGAHESSYYQKNGSFYYEYTSTTHNKVYCPSIHDIQLYCIEKGGTLRETKHMVDEVRAMHGKTGSVSSGEHLTPLPSKIYSNTYYLWQDNIESLNSVAAYIITTPSNIMAPYAGSYTYGQVSSNYEQGENISDSIRQVAIWLNPNTNEGESWEASGAEFTYLDIAQNLSNEADEYQVYEETLASNRNNPIEETTKQKVKINVNNQEQYFIIGPYQMDYIEGKGSNVTFAGISNFAVKGYNDKEKKEFVKDLELISFIQNGEEKTFSYFTPEKEQGYVDHKEQSYPASGKEFYLKMKNPNQGVTEANEKVNYLEVLVDYGYMTAYGEKCELEGRQDVASPKETDHYDSYNRYQQLVSCQRDYVWQVSVSPLPQQNVMDAWGERNYYTYTIPLTGDKNGGGDEPLDITMKLGGNVWEDVPETKLDITNGKFSENDKPIPNVKVTLYEYVLQEDGKIQDNARAKVVNLLSDANKQEMTKEELKKRMNPQLTDENGYYEFNGLDSANKYFVNFEYNGQVYLAGEYLVTNQSEDGTLTHCNSVQDMVVNAKLYNTELWKVTSKVTENEIVRNNYDKPFGEIGSSPKNYESSNSLNSGKLLQEGNSNYNETFTYYELMGFVLEPDGTYKESGIALIDGFYEIDKEGNVVESKKLKEGRISQEIKKYIESHQEYPNQEAMEQIYQTIAGNDATLWKKLQYIEDCKMASYTGSPFNNGKVDLYPVYNDFTIGKEEMVIPGVGTKPPIYEGQMQINAALWQRQRMDLALRKDIYNAALKINGKTEVYQYNKRDANKDYWQINIRMQDYQNYYGTGYNRELYKSDYEYRSDKTNGSGKELELYVTYLITVRNLSQSILGTVTEVVDYYDQDYIYQPDLSWVMYKDKAENSKAENAKITLKDADYEKMMSNLSKATASIPNAKEIKSSETSIYGKATHSDLEGEYNTVYIQGLNQKQLSTGQNAYIYLTFKVKSDNKGPVILDDNNSLKQNYAEINGYKTSYADGTKLPNNVTKSHEDVAGLIDHNSNPGNLKKVDLVPVQVNINGKTETRYEQNFENDTDRAKSIKVAIDDNAIRIINGNVWEDERNKNVSGSVIGDGVRQQGEIGINGVTVQLVEKLANGKEYVWQQTKTKDGGKYEFKEIIPGNYIVRFTYGNTKETVLTVKNGGQNAVSYNGQDFKSTVYQKDMTKGEELASYKDQYYDIRKADSFRQNVSDAKDIWERRTQVNYYSAENVTNNKAEILASPYAQTVNQAQVNELMKNTFMTAETAVIVLEGEYNRTNTNGLNNASNGNTLYLYNNDFNGNYTLNNVDFGLTERPKAQLELDKKVAAVKITHSDGTVAFDTNKAVPDVIWLNGDSYHLNSSMKNNMYHTYYQESKTNSAYNRYSYREEVNKLIANRYQGNNNGLIQITKDEELMHGANIQITYGMVVKNVGETDYTGEDFYYKGIVGNGKVVTTAANQVLDYVSNNLQYRAEQNQGWSVVTIANLRNNADNTVDSRLISNSIENEVSKFNTLLINQSLATALKPGESTNRQTLVLSQVITPENTSDDLSYENIAEIVKTSNTVGRRMAYSIVGNQNPTSAPTEVDASKAEKVIILPPTGQMNMTVTYFSIAAIVGLLLVGGILFIKKKVMSL